MCVLCAVHNGFERCIQNFRFEEAGKKAQVLMQVIHAETIKIP